MILPAILVSGTGALITIEVEVQSEEMHPAVRDHIVKTMADRVWYIPGFSPSKKLGDALQFGDGLLLPRWQFINLREGNAHIFHSNFIGSTLETISAEIRFVEHQGNLMHVGGDRLSAIISIEFASPVFSVADEIPFRLVGYEGDGQFLPMCWHIGWRHNDNFRQACDSCQTGLQHLMYGVEFVTDSILHNLGGNRNLRQTFEDEAVCVENSVNIGAPLTPEGILNWFAGLFQGAIEMCHVETLYILDNRGIKIAEKDIHYEA